jgi:3-hydroxyisobutyrate dehydrogenase-like beta-hydroxyacid dehydrogenase
MAKRLLDAGYDVTVYNRTRARAERLAAAGATVVDTPAAAVEGADVAISTVRDNEASTEVWLGKNGALLALGEQAVAIESSTVTPGHVERLAGAFDESGRRLLEAPVAGTTPQAEGGQLIYMIGGAAEDLDATRDVIDVMAGKVVHVGEHGSAAVLKLCVNGLFGIQVAAMAELLAFADRHGLGAERAMELLADMPVTSPAAAGAGAAIVARKFAPMFPIDLVEKDFGYLAETAKNVGVEPLLATHVRTLLERAIDKGYGGDNITGIAQLYDGAAG